MDFIADIAATPNLATVSADTVITNLIEKQYVYMNKSTSQQNNEDDANDCTELERIHIIGLFCKYASEITLNQYLPQVATFMLQKLQLDVEDIYSAKYIYDGFTAAASNINAPLLVEKLMLVPFIDSILPKFVAQDFKETSIGDYFDFVSSIVYLCYDKAYKHIDPFSTQLMNCVHKYLNNVSDTRTWKPILNLAATIFYFKTELTLAEANHFAENYMTKVTKPSMDLVTSFASRFPLQYGAQFLSLLCNSKLRLAKDRVFFHHAICSNTEYDMQNSITTPKWIEFILFHERNASNTIMWRSCNALHVLKKYVSAAEWKTMIAQHAETIQYYYRCISMFTCVPKQYANVVFEFVNK